MHDAMRKVREDEIADYCLRHCGTLMGNDATAYESQLGLGDSMGAVGEPPGDEDDFFLSSQCEQQLIAGLSDALIYPAIEQGQICRLGSPWACVLQCARHIVSDLMANGGLCYKVGITRGLVHRFYRAEGYNYRDLGYTSMHVVLCSTPVQCVRLEKQLIEDSKTGIGPTPCMNRSKGGESPPKTPHCFTYVVVK